MGSAGAASRGDVDAKALARRAGPSLVAASIMAWLLLRLAWDAGGFFPAAYLSAGTIALVACGLLLAINQPAYTLSTQALVALAALGGLAAWAGLSSLWSPSPSEAMDATQRDLVYVGLLGLALIAAGSGRYARRLVWLALAIIVVVCGAGLVARLLPGVIAEPQGEFSNYRLSYPLTYWNAMGALAAMGTVLSFGLAADPRTRRGLRALAGALSVLLITTMTLSLSRGSWLSLFAGLAALVALGAHRGSLVLTAAVVIPGWVLAVGRLQSYPALTDDPMAGGGQTAAGHAFTAQLLIICAAVAGVLAVLAAARATPEVMERLERLFRPLMIGGAVLVVAALVLGYGARAASVEGGLTSGVDRAENWIDRQWDDFMAPAGESRGVQGRARVTNGAGGSRSDVYRVALSAFGDDPIAGGGGGSFRVRWLAERPVGESVVNAHSLEIETLSELGMIGGALLAAFLGAIGSAILRSRLKPGALPRSQVAAVGGACVVWFVHSAVDWDWQMPAVTGVFLLLACTLFPYGRRKKQKRRRRRSSTRGMHPRPSSA